MKTEFEMKIRTGDLYRFLMYHTYHGFQGIFSIVAGLALIAFYFVRRGSLYNSWLYLAFGVLFLVYLPWTLYTKAAQQVKLGTAFRRPLLYQVSDTDIQVRQEDACVELSWKDVTRVVETGKSYFVYTGRKNAFIWVKSQMQEQMPELKQIMRSAVPEKKRNF